MPRCESRSTRSITVFGLLACLSAGLSGVLAQEPAQEQARVFTASELPRLSERGIALAGGHYTVKVWAPARQDWALTADGSTLTLKARVQGESTEPRWQTVGEADVSGDEPVKVVVASETRTDKGARVRRATRPSRRPCPALLTLSTDPKFKPSQALDLIRGRLDSVDPPADPRRTIARTNKEGADFHPPASAEAWRERARAVREQLLVTMGLWPSPPKTPMNPRVYGKMERDGYTIEKVVLETLPGFTLSGNLYRPTGKLATGQRVGILSPHGHYKEGRVNLDVQERCIRWAKLGAVVFMYDMVGYADSKPFGHAFLNDRLRRWGFSLVTLQTWNSVRALDWLSTLPDVDPARLGCTGESGGGTQTFLLAAIDDRVKVAAPVVMVSDSFQGGCVCENCAGLRIGTDNVEFAALTAPRPMKLVGATGDWTAKTMNRAYPALVNVYTLLGNADRISADVFDFPHNYNQTSRNAVYPFMGRWLLGIDSAASTIEGDQWTESPDDLFTFNDETPAPTSLKTPAELEEHLIQTLQGELKSLAPGTSTAAWDASRAFLKTSQRVRVGLVNPPPSELKETEVRRKTLKGVTVVHALVGRKATGENIPVVRLIPAKPTNRLTVIASAHGKAGLVEASGAFTPLVQELLKRGQSVVGFDPLFVGESLDPTSPRFQRPAVLHANTYNPSLAADQMQDLATVIAWARFQPEVREVSLIGQGPQALIARPLLEGLARTAIDLYEFNDGDGSQPLPAEIDLPGLRQFGGLKAAAALTAPGPVWIFRADRAFDRTWAEKAYALADASHVLRIDDERPSAEEIARWIDTGEGRCLVDCPLVTLSNQLKIYGARALGHGVNGSGSRIPITTSELPTAT